jgi:hypothetical protein
MDMPVRTCANAFYSRLAALLCRNSADILLIIAAAAYCLPSIGYPFGRDQALHFYVGREWLNGLVPYRDAFDNKPPGIYLIHALGIIILGARQWAIRVMELVAVMVTGLVTARAVRRDRPLMAGEAGIITLLFAGFYFTCFDYWDTAQTENWEGLALMASYVVAESGCGARRRAVLSGLLAGAAVLFKLPAAVPAVVLAGVLAARADTGSDGSRMRSILVSTALYGCGFFSLIGVCVAYFALYGGLDAMVDILYGFNTYCAVHSPITSATAWEWVRYFWINHCGGWMWPAFGFWLAGTLSAVRRRVWRTVRGALIAMLLWLSTAASVYIQQKFYAYHWAVMAPFIILCLGYGIAECLRCLPRITLAAAVGFLLYGFLAAPPWYANENITFRTHTISFWKYAAGSLDRASWLAQFTGVNQYDYHAMESLGNMVRDRALPGDRLQARGFEPALYAVSGLRSPSRFFIENPLKDPAMNYHRAAWSAEHERACRENPPRFVVTFSSDANDMAALEKRGYLKIGSAGRFELLERGR